MFILDILKKIYSSFFLDRIGPDFPFTHWMLHYRSLMRYLCRNKFMYFGRNAEVRPYAYFDYCSNISIGDNVVIRPGSMFFANKNTKIIIKNNAMLASCVHIYTDNHKFNDLTKPILFQDHDDFKDVIINEGAWIGANVTILTGVNIGKNSVVAAGSVVTKNVPQFSVVAGVPAQIIKKLT